MINRNDILLEKKRQEQALLERYTTDKKYRRLLEHVKGHTPSDTKMKRALLVTLFENQKQALLKESILKESTLTSGIASIQRYLIPIIHRVFPTLPINDLVGIQPLTGPVGLIFTAEMKATNNKAPMTAGSTIYNNATRNYAAQSVTLEQFQAASSAETEFAGTLAWKPIVPGSVTVVIGSISGVDDGAGAISGTGITEGTINYTSGAISLTLAAGNNFAGTASYTYNSEANTQIPEIELAITSRSVTAVPRKLRAKYSPEALQDMQAIHGIDGEALFVEQFANEIQREISRDTVEKIREGLDSGSKKTWDQARPAAISYDEHKRTFVDALAISSEGIYRQTRRGRGNVIVTGSQASEIVQTLPGFVADSGFATTLPSGRFGVLNNRWVVLNDIDMAETKTLVAYKGETFMDTGFVYSPYVALQLQPLVNPDDFQIRSGFMTRDALTLINSKFYAELTISGAQVIS